MSVAIIINPAAGASSRHPVAHKIAVARDALASAGARGEVLIAERPGHARELARAAVRGGARLVLAWGGDGTANEVGSALAFGDTPLGIIPAGSGNGLARELGLSFRPNAAIRAAVAGRDRTADVGEIAGRLFLNIAGIGFDARVAQRFAARPPGRRGAWPYVAITLREVWSYVPDRYRVTLGGVVHEGSFFTIVLANSCQFGNRMRVAPEAQIDDGLLNALLVDHRSVPGHLWRARHLLFNPLRAEGVVRRPVAEATVEGPAQMACQIDGEPFTAGPKIEVRIHPGAIRLRVPLATELADRRVILVSE
jgi:YegS/Rv2252/BmrU family lipid kinase